MNIDQKLSITSDTELLSINSAIRERIRNWTYDPKESSPYSGCENFEEWTDVIDGEIRKRGLK